MDNTDLEYLLLQGQKLCKDIDSLKPVSKIHKSLRQLCRNADHSTKQLLGGNDEQYAKEFLANRGLDLYSYGSVLKKLRTYQDNAIATCDAKPVMDYSSSVESLMGRYVEDYIKNLEGTDGKEADRYARDMPTSWDKIKKGLVYNEFASDSYDVSFCLQNLPTTKSTHFTFDPSAGGGDFPFVEDVKDYIRAKENGGEAAGELIGRFLDTVHRVNTDATVAHIWNVVRYMHDITPQRSATGSFNERFSDENQTKLVKNAKNYLEDKYQSFLIKETRHLNICGGGVGDRNYMTAVIGAYVFTNHHPRRPAPAHMQYHDFNVDEHTIWPLLYFCFRCGRTDVAEHFVRESGLALDDLVNVFVHLKDGSFTERATTNVGVTLNRYYRTLPAAACENAFRKATFSLLGLVEANTEKAAVAKTVEDKLWMLLVEHFAAKYADASDGLDYGALQRYVLDHGKPYRDQQPHVYFELLFLVGQFESAVDFLYRSAAAAAYSNHAVHIAIGLREKRVLATPGYLQAPFLSNENVDVRFARLNYTRLMLLFCHEFESKYPHYAAYYYYFLRDVHRPGDDDSRNGGDGGGLEQHQQLFHRCVADLATSFDGNMCEWMFGTEGGRLRDAFSADTVDAVVDRTLELALDRSRPEVAVKLYTMRSDRAAYGVMNGMLSRAVYEFDVSGARERLRRRVVGGGDKNFHDRVYEYAEQLHAKRGGPEAPVTRGGPVDTFRVLRDMYAFFYHWSEFRFRAAVEKAADSGLVPFAEGRDFRRCLDNCTGRYGELVQRNVSHFLKSVTDALCDEHRNVSSGRPNRDDEDDSTGDDDGSLIEDEDSDTFDRSREACGGGGGGSGWTKRRLRNAVKTVYLFAAQLPVNVALDAVEYISANASIMRLD